MSRMFGDQDKISKSLLEKNHQATASMIQRDAEKLNRARLVVTFGIAQDNLKRNSYILGGKSNREINEKNRRSFGIMDGKKQ